MNEIPENAFKNMTTNQKIEYIFDYYKFHIGAVILVLAIIIYILHGIITHKDPAINITVSNLYLDTETETLITDSFLKSQNIDTNKNKAEIYSIAVTKEDNAGAEYTYASHMKLMTMITAEQIDVILMDKNSYELFSSEGYLSDLRDYISDDTLFTDGKTDHIILPASKYFKEAGTDDIYLAVAANTPHKEISTAFIEYLLSSIAENPAQ